MEETEKVYKHQPLFKELGNTNQDKTAMSLEISQFQEREKMPVF